MRFFAASKNTRKTYIWLRTVSDETRTLLPGSGTFGLPTCFRRTRYILRRTRPWCGMRKTRPGPAEDVSHARGLYCADGICNILYLCISMYQLYEGGTFRKRIFCRLHLFRSVLMGSSTAIIRNSISRSTILYICVCMDPFVFLK